MYETVGNENIGNEAGEEMAWLDNFEDIEDEHGAPSDISIAWSREDAERGGNAKDDLVSPSIGPSQAAAEEDGLEALQLKPIDLIFLNEPDAETEAHEGDHAAARMASQNAATAPAAPSAAATATVSAAADAPPSRPRHAMMPTHMPRHSEAALSSREERRSREERMLARSPANPSASSVHVHPGHMPAMAPYPYALGAPPHHHQQHPYPMAAAPVYRAGPDPSHIDAHLKLQERQLLAQYHEIQLARHALQVRAQYMHEAQYMHDAHLLAREQQAQYMHAAAAAAAAAGAAPMTPAAAAAYQTHRQGPLGHSRHAMLQRANSDGCATMRPLGSAAYANGVAHHGPVTAAAAAAAATPLSASARAAAAAGGAAGASDLHRATSDDRHCAKRRLSEHYGHHGCISPKNANVKRFAALGINDTPSPTSSPEPDTNQGVKTAMPELHATRVTKANRRSVCEFCLRKFDAPDDLLEHREKHILGENSFTCVQPGCHKTYSTGEGLRLHVRNVHLDAKIWRCLADDCGRSFVRQSDLRMHIIRIHSNIRPFPCVLETCKKSFACHSELRRHVQSCHKVSCPKPEDCKPVVNPMDLAFVKRLMLKLE
ncbi:Zinc finger protein [Hondaea fermentalgiana]|uniref:Zinc finger protein n=1 Tax=Hondaea fermentalgiana TaxID=2315210 RepID=A0A2R5GCV7_9STRA|nr:Zinc finger protein [Hondaea fermentalgiana]|eukprot:GBG27538.1 Zinc finger protein [Hondaea fermentalgiana]